MRYKLPIRKLQVVAAAFLLSTGLAAAQQGTVKGTVKDGQEVLPGASIFVQGSGAGVLTGSDGTFSLPLPAGTHIVNASFTGLAPEQQSVTVRDGETIEVNFDLKTTSLNELVVLGSRGEPRSQLDTPVPVDVIDVKNLVRDVGQVNLNQILNYVAPSFNSNTQVLGDGTDHIDPASLRGLGPDQVLVLINGKRRHTTSLININGTFGKGSVGTDLNAIPTSSIKRIEILRDGASAQYGSDAIAGVINIILEDNVNELRASITAGGFVSKNSEGGIDGETVQANANYGLAIGSKGGFFNLAGSFDFRNPTNRMKEFTGVIFSDYNNPALFPAPTGADITNAELQRRGLTRSDFNSRIGQASARGGAISFNSVIPLDNAAEIYAFGGLNYRHGESAAFRRTPSQLTQNIAEIYPLGYLPLIGTDNYDQSFATGIRGKVGQWNADLSNTFGRNQIDFTTSSSLNASLLKASPTRFTDGGYRFAQNTTNLDLNRNFDNVLSGLNVAFGAEHRYENYQIIQGEEKSWGDYGRAVQVGVDATGKDILIPSLTGNVFTLKAANGGNYAGGAQAFPGFRPENAINVSRTSVGLYTDLALNITQSWLMDGALRFENYSDFGSTLNWKLSTRYKIGENFAIRAAASTGFRAPSLHQRYFSATSSLFVDGQIIQSGTFTNESRPAQLLGIPELKQETSINYSAGFTGSFGKFKVTVDGYYVRIDNRIIYTGQFSGSNAATASPQDREIFQLLSQANAQTARFFANAIDTETKGIDAVLTYSERFGKSRFRADLSGTFVKTNIVGNVKASPLLAGKESTYFDPASRIYLESAVPRVKSNLTLSYNIGKFGAFLRNVYFGPVDAATNVEADAQTFGSKIITDLSLSYDISTSVRFTLGANNLLDVYPDETIGGNRGAGYFVYSRTGQQFGFNGRFAFARLSLTL
ncbi:TonB-dependent receptor [Dyadobacter sp. CY323]|uniref:TonB-dependent receptor n=1 Tax=Dyadobacter sp. CY323 TaxID=2907302 RepID=UPI001F2E1A50|nr:TonB-dependent receptor [Dyadobacter sp. CY323]MCE6991260.1 TonB-dependent receptor [Dyadobacter sp. CY323]